MKSIILKKIDRILENSSEKLMHIPASKSGMYFDSVEGTYELSHILSTNQAFVTGMAIWAYYETKDKKYIDWCEKFYNEYLDKVTNQKFDTSQDTGMLYNLYAVPLYNITGDEKYKRLAICASDEVARRFIPDNGYIKAWGRCDCHYPPYIDSYADDNPFFNENKGLMVIETLMNIPLLYWAVRETNQPYYERIASRHIATTCKYLIRSDFTTVHGYRFNESNGAAYCEDNYFGYNEGSYWAKGAAMAIYGITLAHRYSRYCPRADLNTALRLLDRFIDSCGGKLPVWDFAAPEKTVDTTAAAIVLCAIHEIQKMVSTPKIDDFEKMLITELKAYIDENETTDGILKGQNGKDEYDIVGDYFITEALFATGRSIWY